MKNILKTNHNHNFKQTIIQIKYYRSPKSMLDVKSKFNKKKMFKQILNRWTDHSQISQFLQV